MAEELRRYRFGPLERRGLIGSLRPAQVLVIAASLDRRRHPDARAAGGAGVLAALALVLAALAFCFWPIAGRSAEEWLPVVGRYARAARPRTAPPPVVGAAAAGVRDGSATGGPSRSSRFPTPARGLELLAAPLRGEAVGVVKDRRARTYTAALAVKVTSFGLLDRAEQESRQAGWGAVLAGLAREGSPVSRSSGSSAPCRPTATRSAATSARRGTATPSPLDSLPMQSYLDLVERRARRDDGSRALRLPPDRREARLAADQARGRKGRARRRRVRRPPARARGARRAARRRRRPGRRRAPARDARERDPDRVRSVVAARASRVSPRPTPIATASTRAPPGRSATETSWGALPDRRRRSTRPTGSRAGRGPTSAPPSSRRCSCTPRWCERSRSRSSRSRRCERSARSRPRGRATSPTSELRGRMGFIETARRRRMAEATARREEELADGHAAVRFAGYVTVSARTHEELERHCSEIEHAAQMARLELAPPLRAAGGGVHLHAAALPGTAMRAKGQPGHRTTTAHVQAAYPFVAEGGLGGRGVYIGRDVYGGSFCYDPWELYGRELTSPNAVVIGIVGRAKSSLVKTYVFRQAVFGRQAWIVDVKGEYDRLAEALGVRPIALSPGGRVRLNPLTPRGGPERQLNLLYSVAAAALERPLTPGGEARGAGGAARPRRAAGRRADAARRRRRPHPPARRDGGRARDGRRRDRATQCGRWRSRSTSSAPETSAGCSTGRRRRASTSTRRSSSSTSAPSSTRTRPRSGS